MAREHPHLERHPPLCFQHVAAAEARVAMGWMSSFLTEHVQEYADSEVFLRATHRQKGRES